MSEKHIYNHSSKQVIPTVFFIIYSFLTRDFKTTRTNIDGWKRLNDVFSSFVFWHSCTNSRQTGKEFLLHLKVEACLITRDIIWFFSYFEILRPIFLSVNQKRWIFTHLPSTKLQTVFCMVLFDFFSFKNFVGANLLVSFSEVWK